jgi:glucokinase
MILGIDIGGTKTLLGLFQDNGKLAERLKFETPTSYEDFTKELSKHLSTFTDGHSVRRCVVAVPGKLNRSTGVAEALGNRDWADIPIGEDISQMLGAPVQIENDANLAGLSEALLLSEYRRVLYITISTGIGGVIIQDGHIEETTADMEPGQLMLEHDGSLISWEHLASGKAIYKRTGKKVMDITDPQELHIMARHIALGLIGIISTTIPEVVVIGGGVGSHLMKFKEYLENALAIYRSNVVDLPPILKARNPEEAVIYGCYALAKQQEEQTA